MKTTRNKFIRLLVPGLALAALIGLLAVNVFGKYRKTVALTAEISYRVQSGSPGFSITVAQKEDGLPAAEIVITGKTDAPANLYLSVSGESCAQFTPDGNWVRMEASPIEGLTGDFYQYQKSIPTGDSVVELSLDGDAEAETQLNLTAYLVREAVRDGKAPLPYLASQTCSLTIAGPEEPDPSEPESEPTEPTPEPTTLPQPEPTTEPQPEPTTEPQPEPQPEPTTEPQPEPTTEPLPEPTTEPLPEPTDDVSA